MDILDPSQWLRWVFSAGKYVYQNIELPRVSETYRTPWISLPSREQIVVGAGEILSSVHPNYYAVAFIFTCAGIFVYIKLRYPFWNTQPVVHTYDYFRKWVQTTPVVLQKYLYKTRYYDKTKQIQTRDMTRIPADEIERLCEFIQSNYIGTDRLLSTITEKTIRPYFTGHNAPSYISVHRELDETITGVCSSRLLHMFSYPESTLANPTVLHTEMYFMDYVCIRREVTGIAEKLFHTHEYNIRIMNPTISVSMFRKEGQLCEGVVPFSEYAAYTFYMQNLPLSKLPDHFTISRVAKENVDLLHDIYHILTTPEHGAVKMFSICLLPDIANIVELLVSRQLYLYCLKKGGHLYGVYFFKDMNVHYEDIDSKTLGLVATIQNTDCNELFMLGFAHSLRQILKETPQYKMMCLNNLGHNAVVLRKWREYHHTILEIPCALYLYNYVYPKMPVHPSSIFSIL
jgi:hypothetical protein